MATSYNPTYLRKIDLICDKSKNTSTSILNELIKDWFGNHNLLNNIEDIEKNSNKKDSIINFINTNKEEKIGKIYWDIEAQKFLIE